MGLLIKGQWHDQWYQTSKGEFIREDAQFRSVISNEADAQFPAESGRYHLLVSLACPWAHRTLIFRELKGLSEHIGVTTVDAKMLDNGWEFSKESKTENNNNPLGDLDYLHQVYCHAQPDYSGRVTVPILWDKKLGTIVNNESAEIIRMFNSSFNHITGDDKDFYPEELRYEIDQINTLIYETINNGVYRAGFATTQGAYDKAFNKLFNTLDALDTVLSENRFLLGSKLTEADWRLFTTLIRFDSVYYGHFKTNKKRIDDYPNLSNYLRELYQLPGISDTCDFKHIKTHYYFSHTSINPTQIIPAGPEIDYNAPFYRGMK